MALKSFLAHRGAAVEHPAGGRVGNCHFQKPTALGLSVGG
jgi:hypothetical protein